jgi:transposase, IS5 family
MFSPMTIRRGDAPHWPVVTMLKIVFLQKCFGLSDPMAEEMLRDRISFRRFVGLSFDDKTPDHSTIILFQSLAGTGSWLDAVRADARDSPWARAGAEHRHAGGCFDHGSAAGRQSGRWFQERRSLASKTAKSGRVYHGYRVHIATDRRGIITDYVYDTAVVSEYEHFDHLIRNERQAVFADSGCRSAERVKRLRQAGVVAGMCHRRVRGQKELSPEQKRLNRLIAPIRAFVEHPMAWIKVRLNNRRVRYRGVSRNGLDFDLSAMACNFCRSFWLTAT